MTRTVLILIIVVSVVGLLSFITAFFLYSRYTELKKYVIDLQNNAIHQQNTLDRIIGGSSGSQEHQRVLYDRQSLAHSDVISNPPAPETFKPTNGGVPDLFPLMNNLMNIFQSAPSVTDDIEVIPDDEESVVSSDDEEEGIAVEEIIKEELQELEKSEKKESPSPDNTIHSSPKNSKIST